MADEDVHIFSIHEPGSRSPKYKWIPVEVGKEYLTHEEILAAEKMVQQDVNRSGSTAVVKYFATADKATIIGMNDTGMNSAGRDSTIPFDPHFDEPRQD